VYTSFAHCQDSSKVLLSENLVCGATARMKTAKYPLGLVQPPPEIFHETWYIFTK